MEKKKLIMVYPSYSTFVQRDFEILDQKFDVTKHEIVFSKPSLKSISLLFKELLFWIKSKNKYDISYIWFGDYHSFLPILFSKLYKKKSYIVIGGSDVANIPEIKYGSFSNPLRAFCTRKSFKWADLCIPVVEALDVKLKKLVPQAKSKVINTGYDYNTFIAKNDISRKNQVITVSITKTKSRLKLKGLDRFTALAKELPELNFLIVGIEKEYETLFDDKPKNLKLLPPCKPEELVYLYSESKYYAQLSLSEGLPNAICEAMLCGCIPIVTNVGGNKNAVGNNGYINNWNIDDFKEYLQITHSEKESRQARKYIIDNFDMQKRYDELLNII